MGVWKQDNHEDLPWRLAQDISPEKEKHRIIKTAMTEEKIIGNNFRNPKTGEEVFVTKYKCVFNAGGTIDYKDAQGKDLVADDGVTKLVYIEKKGEFNVSFGKFQSSTPAQRQRILKKRHLEHSRKERDKFHHLNKPTEKP